MSFNYKTISIIILTFGILIILFVNQATQSRSYTRLQYEYETLKSHLGLDQELLNKMLYGRNVIGRLSLVKIASFEDSTYIFVRNAGDIPLSGFELVSEEFYINAIAKPDILLPNSGGIIAVSRDSVKSGETLTIKTKQGAMLHVRIG